MKIYHEQGSQLNVSNQGVDFFFGEISNYNEIGNGYFDFDITLRKIDGIFNDVDGDGKIDEPIRLLNNAFAYAFSIATLSTTGGKKIEQNKHVGHVSTIMRLLTSRDGDLLSYFDKIMKVKETRKNSFTMTFES